MAGTEPPAFTRLVLEEVAGAMGLDRLGSVRLGVEFNSGDVRRWGAGEPHNGADALAAFDVDLRARLERLFRTM